MLWFNRDELKKGFKLTLIDYNNKTRDYIIIEKYKGKDKKGNKSSLEYNNSNVEGRSCICYVAERVENDKTVKVILKEFYPSSFGESVSRIHGGLRDGQVNLKLDKDFEYKDYTECTELEKQCRDFIKGAKKIRQYSDIVGLSKYICSDEKSGLLVGNGTYYCENYYYETSHSWKNESKYVKGDEIISTGLGLLNALNKIHKVGDSGDALVDIKPQDVLIVAQDDFISVDYNRPVLFDFDSVMNIGKRCNLEDIKKKTTKIYRPYYFEKSYLEDGGVITINEATDNSTLLMVIKDLFLNRNKAQKTSDDIYTKLEKTLGKYIKASYNKDDEDNLIMELKKIRTDIQDEEYVTMKRKNSGYTKFFKILWFIFTVLTVILYAVFGSVMIYSCKNPEKAQMFLSKYDIEYWEIAIILLCISILIFIMKYILTAMAKHLTHIDVAVRYYDYEDDGEKKDVRNAEHNTFVNKTNRWKTTFQDDSDNNKVRQRLRHILWVALALVIISGLIISIEVGKLPLFFIIGFIAIIIFMYADLIPSARYYYQHCQNDFDLEDYNAETYREKKAVFYMREYDATVSSNGAFDLSSNLYKENHRNLFKIKEDVLTTSYNIEKIENRKTFNKLIDNNRYYKKRDYYRECRNKNDDGSFNTIDLKFKPKYIKHIYKMVFDRIANVQFIFNMSVLVLMLFTIFFDYVTFTGNLQTYFMIPQTAYFWIILIMVFSVFGVNIIQIINLYNHEMVTSDMSYKSKFILDDYLNDFLVEDIALGVVKPIDIARGINQAVGYVYTAPRSKLEGYGPMDDYKNPVNIRMFHHEEFANRRRLAISLWLTFGIVFSLIVWMLGDYFLFFPLLVLFIVLHLYVRQKILPNHNKNQLISDIIAIKNKK